MPALIRMEDQPTSVRESGESFIQHLFYLTVIGSVTDCITDDFTIIQVKYRREIEFIPKQGKLGHIGYPLLIRSFRMEISCQKIWRNLADFSTVRTILFHSHHTF